MNKQILLKAVFAFLSVLAFNAGAAVADAKTDAKAKQAPTKKADKAKPAPAKTEAATAKTEAAPAKTEAAPAKAEAAPAKAEAALAKAEAAAEPTQPPAVNSFNRLMRKAATQNLPPADDGIHDPTKQGTRLLQSPLEAFANLPKSNKGNKVDWMKAIEGKQITPRAAINDPNAKMKTKNLDVVIKVKGSMPNVLFSHMQHTQWLACANCHPDLFDEEAGSNPMNMATFSQGERCGACHNKVAFPLADCRRCHNTAKPEQASAKP